VTRKEISPALMGSVLLHATVAVMFLISWNFARDLKVGTVVPVTIVSSAPPGEIRPAVQAPETQTAQTEQPAPDAPLESVAPQPEPTPTPAPTPTPTKAAEPAAKPPTPKPKPKPQPTKPDRSLDLDALSASVSKMLKPSSAAKGADRAETASQARTTLGARSSAAAVSGLQEELQRRWHPNCSVEGGRDVQVAVTFVIGVGGQVRGDVASHIHSAQSPVSRAAAERAVRAVYAAAPFQDLPRAFYGDEITVNFNAREACSP
jgi:outer membrane biosynthesis protein TonB